VPRAPATAHHAAPAPRGNGSSFPSPALIVVALLFVAAAVWFALEIRRNRAGRRSRGAAPGPGAAPVAGAVAAAAAGSAGSAGAAAARAASADGAQLTAIAEQLGALVASIDRLVTRMGDGGGADPQSKPELARVPVPANPAPMFFAPAAQRGPDAEFDPYDWPTQRQLDDFAARRRTTHPDA
jgi:hypothetical protein